MASNPPTNLELLSVDGDQFTIGWTDNASTNDGYRVYVSDDEGSTWTQDSGDLAADTEQYQTTNLLDGEQYLIKVAAFDADGEYDDVIAVGSLGGAGYGQFQYGDPRYT